MSVPATAATFYQLTGAVTAPAGWCFFYLRAASLERETAEGPNRYSYSRKRCQASGSVSGTTHNTAGKKTCAVPKVRCFRRNPTRTTQVAGKVWAISMGCAVLYWV